MRSRSLGHGGAPSWPGRGHRRRARAPRPRPLRAATRAPRSAPAPAVLFASGPLRRPRSSAASPPRHPSARPTVRAPADQPSGAGKQRVGRWQRSWRRTRSARRSREGPDADQRSSEAEVNVDTTNGGREAAVRAETLFLEGLLSLLDDDADVLASRGACRVQELDRRVIVDFGRALEENHLRLVAVNDLADA